MYRFNPKYLEVLDKIKNGDLGEIYAEEAHMDCKHNPETRQWLQAFPGGMMFFLGCHLVDLIYRIQGEPLEVIPMNCATGFDGVTADDYGMVCFRYPRGISFAKTCAYENGGYQRRQLVVCGSKGTVILQPLERFCPGGMYTGMRECYEANWHAPEGLSQSEPFGRYDAMMVNFHDLVVGKKENPFSYEHDYAVQEVLLQACGGVACNPTND
jgi:predicted dehydrogenase